MMDRNDYPIIVVRILKYLYRQLIEGKPVEGWKISYITDLYSGINRDYWAYIMHNLRKSGYIRGITTKRKDGKYIIGDLRNVEITPADIIYLLTDPVMEKYWNISI